MRRRKLYGYKAVIFDCDGTLVDARASIDLIHKGYHKLYPERAVKPREDFIPCYGNTNAQTFDMLNILPEHRETFFDYCIQGKDFSKCVCPFPGIDKVILELKEKGIYLGINTSRTKEILSEIRLQLGDALDMFDLLVTSDIVDNPKPHPESLLLCLEKAGCKAEEMIYIGDNPIDQQCADSAGIPFALALWGTLTPEKFHDCIQLNSVSDILGLIV